MIAIDDARMFKIVRCKIRPQIQFKEKKSRTVGRLGSGCHSGKFFAHADLFELAPGLDGKIQGRRPTDSGLHRRIKNSRIEPLIDVAATECHDGRLVGPLFGELQLLAADGRIKPQGLRHKQPKA